MFRGGGWMPATGYWILKLAVLALVLVGCGAPAGDEPGPTTVAVVPEATSVELGPPSLTVEPGVKNSATAAPTNTLKPPPTETQPAPIAPVAEESPTKALTVQPTTEPITEPTAQPSGDNSGVVTVEIAEGSQARYLVREQLARLPLPNDAVGETSEVSGSLVFDAGGRIMADESRIVVDLASLVSDSSRRDGYVRDRSLETDSYPDAIFVASGTPGLPWPLPSQGEASFQIVGDITVHGVTRPLTWEATAQFETGRVTGQAKTSVSFQDFEIPIPRVRVVLSVEETIRLELDFVAVVNGQWPVAGDWKPAAGDW